MKKILIVGAGVIGQAISTILESDVYTKVVVIESVDKVHNDEPHTPIIIEAPEYNGLNINYRLEKLDEEFDWMNEPDYGCQGNTRSPFMWRDRPRIRSPTTNHGRTLACLFKY